MPVLREMELEGGLDGARAADLVEGFEAAIGAAGAQAARQRRRRSPKTTSRWIGLHNGAAKLLSGGPKLAWLNRLKNSDRKRSPGFSVR
jgi:hypothetical protein